MKMPSDTIYIQSAQVVGAGSMIELDWTEWASQALVEGFNSKHLRMLAASSPDEHVVPLFADLALAELNIPPVAWQDAKLTFVAQLLHRMLSGKIEHEFALEILRGLYLCHEDDETYKEFYYLREDYLYAREGSFECCRLFDPSTENLEKVVDDFARKWLIANNLSQET